MSKFLFELNSDGVKELLNLDEMKNYLIEEANKVQTVAGEGYVAGLYEGKNRPNASILAKTKNAKKDNLENNTLLKALGYVRGK